MLQIYEKDRLILFLDLTFTSILKPADEFRRLGPNCVILSSLSLDCDRQIPTKLNSCSLKLWSFQGRCQPWLRSWRESATSQPLCGECKVGVCVIFFHRCGRQIEHMVARRNFSREGTKPRTNSPRKVDYFSRTESANQNCCVFFSRRFRSII